MYLDVVLFAASAPYINFASVKPAKLLIPPIGLVNCTPDVFTYIPIDNGDTTDNDPVNTGNVEIDPPLVLETGVIG